MTPLFGQKSARRLCFGMFVSSCRRRSWWASRSRLPKSSSIDSNDFQNSNTWLQILILLFYSLRLVQTLTSCGYCEFIVRKTLIKVSAVRHTTRGRRGWYSSDPQVNLCVRYGGPSVSLLGAVRWTFSVFCTLSRIFGIFIIFITELCLHRDATLSRNLVFVILLLLLYYVRELDLLLPAGSSNVLPAGNWKVYCIRVKWSVCWSVLPHVHPVVRWSVWLFARGSCFCWGWSYYCYGWGGWYSGCRWYLCFFVVVVIISDEEYLFCYCLKRTFIGFDRFSTTLHILLGGLTGGQVFDSEIGVRP